MTNEGNALHCTECTGSYFIPNDNITLMLPDPDILDASSLENKDALLKAIENLAATQVTMPSSCITPAHERSCIWSILHIYCT